LQGMRHEGADRIGDRNLRHARLLEIRVVTAMLFSA